MSYLHFANDGADPSAVLECSVRSWGSVRFDPSDLADLRKSLVAKGDTDAAQSVVRTCDEQSALAVAAMLEAARGYVNSSFSKWGLIAAPRYLGRLRVAAAIARFRKVGVRGMPPSLIPFQTSHAVSGTLSLYFGIRGSAVSVGITEEHISEGILAAITWCQSADLPGVWLVMTGWDPEPVPDDSGGTITATAGYGVAMAIERTTADESLRLRYSSEACELNDLLPVSIRSLAERLANLSEGTWSVPMIGGGAVAFQRMRSAMRMAS